ncbi:MAG: 16S rRNA (uracil(1498)-N(3))-methyltransferase [Firmicutes bacterium]|nr:16S rRNA (uracil(1498)-N(3))-methyltransferase [Bacillota bacterium]
MARFFLDLEGIPPHRCVTFNEDDAVHIARVLRLKPGEQVEVVLAGRVYLAQLTTVQPGLVQAEVGEPLDTNSESGLALHLFQGLPKGDKLDLVIQKATELGVTSITPVLTERVVVKLKSNSVAKKVQRWQRIALEAAKLSKRQMVPQVNQPISLQQLPKIPQHQLALVAWEEERAGLRPLLQNSNYQSVSVLVGPEGGLASGEIDFLLSQGWQSVSLGPRILRTETAPLALLAIIQYELGDLGGSK